MKFEEFNFSPEILKAIKRNGFEEPTPIQNSCIPEIMAGKDVVGQSLTGSGKTAAFGLPLVQKIQPGGGIRALILTPTRELTVQVADRFVSFSQFLNTSTTAVYGGVGMQPQVDALRKADIVVATPGRLLDHMNRGTIKLNKVSYVVIDEADKMFEMGFVDDVREIIGHIPSERQTLLFSATMTSDIRNLIKKYLKTPVMIKEEIHVDKSLLKQVFYNLKPHDKFSLLVHLLKNKTDALAIVFCATRREVDVLTKNLKMQKIHAMAVHGGLSQNKRSEAVDSLKKENIQVLVATDVAARGLDINDISHIYNYDSPKNSCEYTHRIGRTARAGKYGEAVTLLTEKDHENFRNVQSDSEIKIQKETVPEFVKLQYIRDMPRGRGGGGRPGGFSGNRGGANRSRSSGGFSGNRSGSGGFSGNRSSGNRSEGNSSGFSGNRSRSSGGFSGNRSSDNRSEGNSSGFSGNRNSSNRSDSGSENRNSGSFKKPFSPGGRVFRSNSDNSNNSNSFGSRPKKKFNPTSSGFEHRKRN